MEQESNSLLLKEDCSDMYLNHSDMCLSLSEVVDKYKSWVQREQFLVLEKKTSSYTQHKKVHACKRGDSYYVERTGRVFKNKISHIPEYEYFNKKDYGIKKTDIILVTLTYDKKDSENWKSNSKHFAEFMNRMRSAYGNLEFLRAWESHKDGFPHMHVLIRNTKGFYCRRINKVWRVVGKDFNRIKGYWTRGFSDIVAISSHNEAFFYIAKYITKSWNDEDGKHIITLSMLWLYKKRAFSISKRFFNDCRADLIIPLHNLYANRSEWSFIGIMTLSEYDEYTQLVRELETEQFRKDRKEQFFDVYI